MTDTQPRQLRPGFAPWIWYVPGKRDVPGPGAIVVFPHAGAAAASYQALATALTAGGDTFVVQYPQRAERVDDPPPGSVHELARGLFDAGPWSKFAPLRLFGHSMGAVVAFEFARIAEQHGVAIQKLWVSAGPAPSAVAGLPKLPTGEAEILEDVAELGASDPRLLEDEEYRALLAKAARADYEALNRYDCAAETRVRTDIYALGGRDDTRVDAASLRQWADHTQGTFSLSLVDGGHFYIYDEATDVAQRIITDA